MIRVVVKKDTNDNYKNITIRGHAYSGEPGFDLVCAGVSAIVFGTLNALSLKSEVMPNIKVNEQDDALIEITNIKDKKSQEILEVMLIQLSSVEESYSKYISIKQ
jgi:uncharacterized protein YsxB (DUF464 family)